MAGYKETPRQKMIAMMYLVLTGLLALNVSKQILDAFLVVNESMEITNENFSKKLDNTIAKFKIQYQLNPNKVGPYWEKAQVAHKLSKDFTNYIDSIKVYIVKLGDGLETMKEAREIKLKDVKRKDNYDRTTTYFIGNAHDGSDGEARKLSIKMEEYKKKMLDLVDPKFRNVIKIGLDTKGPFYDLDGNKQSWEMHNFYRTILVADVTILNKIKAEVFNAEFDVSNYLLSSISAEDFKYDKIDARVIPKSGYVFMGDEYQAEIVVVAYDTKAKPNVRYILGSDSLTAANYNNATPLEGSNGVVYLKLAGSSEGLKKFAGIIKIVNPLGDTMSFHFKDEFIVAKPGLTISPSKMNVFYIGVDNPVDILVPGSPERILPSVSVGNIRADGKQWIVSGLPNGIKEAIVSVNAVFSGKTKSMGSATFRLKKIPTFNASIDRNPEGTVISRSDIPVGYIAAEKPVGFDFDLTYKITSFVFVSDIDGSIIEKNIPGNRIPDDLLTKIKRAKKNNRIWIENIMAIGPGGEQQLKNISYKFK
ncbi:MAG: gliding motility protein GldM [Bacteroidetes bacterium]|nr:gliding motility protein GldM [Bacteroidota bacterium]